MSESFTAPPRQPLSMPVFIDASGTKLADLNTVTQKVCSRLNERFSQFGAIIRCDDLPQVVADDNDIMWGFEEAVNMILNSVLQGAKLLIHIKSTASDTNFVCIDVCTNGKLNTHWQEQQAPLLAECKIVCHRNGGTFNYNAFTGGASLFTIVLPAKQNITTLG